MENKPRNPKSTRSNIISYFINCKHHNNNHNNNVCSITTNNIVVIATAPSKEAFTKFFTAPAAQDRMKNAGISTPPNITFLESKSI